MQSLKRSKGKILEAQGKRHQWTVIAVIHDTILPHPIQALNNIQLHFWPSFLVQVSLEKEAAGPTIEKTETGVNRQ